VGRFKLDVHPQRALFPDFVHFKRNVNNEKNVFRASDNFIHSNSVFHSFQGKKRTKRRRPSNKESLADSVNKKIMIIAYYLRLLEHNYNNFALIFIML
jgi:hypothetical protein